MPDSSTNGKQPLNDDKMTVQSANSGIPDAAEMMHATESKAPKPCGAAPDLALTPSSYTEGAPGQHAEPKQEETIETSKPPLQAAAPTDIPPAMPPSDVTPKSPSKSAVASDLFVGKLPRHTYSSSSDGSFPATILETGESVVSSSADDKLSVPKILDNSPRTLVTRSAPVSGNSSPLMFPAENIPLHVPPLESLAAQLLPVNTPTSQVMSPISNPSSRTNSPVIQGSPVKKASSRFRIVKQAQQAAGPSTTDAAQGSAAVLPPPPPALTTIGIGLQAPGSTSVSSAPATTKQSRFKVVNQTSSQSVTPTSAASNTATAPAIQAPPSNAPNNAQPETPAPSLPPSNISVPRRQSLASSGQAPLHKIASSDSLSLGSAPCPAENFDQHTNPQLVPQENGAAVQQQQEQQQQFDDVNQQQLTQGATMVQQTTQLLVAVPLRQAPNEYQQQVQRQVQQQALGEDGNQKLPQQQQQPQTMLVVKMGTKKKGRFKLLEENTGAAGGENALSSAAEPAPTLAPTPTSTSIPIPTTVETPALTQEQAPTPAASQTPEQNQTQAQTHMPSTVPAPTQMLNTIEQAPAPSKNGAIPRSIALPAHGVSSSSAISQLSTGVPGAAQTFDGTGVPTVKKKGRFVVTNVKDPGRLSAPAATQQQQPQQQEQAPVTNSESTTHQQNQQQTGNQQHQSQQSQHSQHSQQNEQQQQQQPQNQQSQQQQFMAQNEQSFSTLQSNGVELQQFQPYMTHQTLSGPAVITYSTQCLAPQQQAYQLQQYTIQGGQQYIAVEAIPQQVQLQQDIPQQMQETLPTGNQTSTPPATPGSVPTGSVNDSQWGAQATVAIPNAPVPQVSHPQSGDKAKLITGAVKWKSAQSKTPQSFDKGAGGLGKVFHYLEQMKMEVTDADRTIKTLKTDMKFLKQKNKEWETKNREMEKKVQEERSLREAVEAKLRDLRKRLREGKIDIKTLKPIEVGAGENPGNVNTLMEPPVATGTTSGDTAQQGQPSDPIDTVTKTADGTTRPKPPTQGVGADTPTAGSKSKLPVQPVDPLAPRKSTLTRPPAPSAQNGAVAKGAKPKPKAVPIASNGMAKTNTESGIGTPKPVRAKLGSNGQAQTNKTPASNIANGAPSLPRSGSKSKITQPGQPSLQSGGVKQAATASSPAPKASHASDFDPLRPTASHSDIPSDVVISIPASVTLENHPIFSGQAVFQTTTNEQGMVTANAFQQVTPILSQNPFIVFTNNELQNQGLVQTSSGGLQLQSNGGNLQGFQQHAIMTGGFHDFQQQPVMMVQQPPPIMLQQVPNMYAGQWTQQTLHVQNPQATSENQPLHHQEQHQNQGHRQRQVSSISNPFGDPFDDPFDDLLVNQPNQ